MTTEPLHLDAFHAEERQPGESVLCWIPASRGGRSGIAILTDRRLYFRPCEERRSNISVTGSDLLYLPSVDGEEITAHFEAGDATLEFLVVGEEGKGRLDNLLGNLSELRQAQAKMQDAGLDPRFVSPSPKGATEGVSGVYQLIRLKEMVRQGMLAEIEFLMERSRMIDEFRAQGAAD